ncbi:MAG: hypothetical protein NTY93_03175 [Candidatus Kaiserbacteria bacterium]|nr:hypothetical protein [Candidatus Kaiserbacteria bacterium]
MGNDAIVVPRSIGSIAFRINEHGHDVCVLAGDFSLTGEEEVGRLKEIGFVCEHAEQMLKSNEYNLAHLLVEGKMYEIVFLLGKDIIARDSNRTIVNLCKKVEKFGYDKPPAGITPYICEAIFNGQIEGKRHIIIPQPIHAADHNPYTFEISISSEGKSYLGSHWSDPNLSLEGNCIYIFQTDLGN